MLHCRCAGPDRATSKTLIPPLPTMDAMHRGMIQPRRHDRQAPRMSQTAPSTPSHDTGDTGPAPGAYTPARLAGLLLGPILGLLVYWLLPDAHLGHAGRAVLACTTLMAVYWMTEALPLAATALIPLVLLPITGGAPVEQVAPAYGNPVVFMYMGGFVLALAIQKWNLHRRVALVIINALGTTTRRIVLGIMLATGLMTLFISNAATALMMLPVALALIGEMRDKQILDAHNARRFAKCLLLAVAYTATIGGLATLVAAVPNALLAAIARDQLDHTITFARWLLFAGPVSLVMLAVLYVLLTRISYRIDTQGEGQVDFVRDELKALGPLGPEEKVVACVFVATAFLWVFKSLIGLGHLHDATVSMLATVTLFMLPASRPHARILEWADMTRLPWGVLVLFGGGLALAGSFAGAGVNDWIADTLRMLQGFGPFLAIALLTLIVLAMTEILSNTAVSNLVLPLCVGLGAAIGMDPLPLMAAAALAAGSCYMLPVATPPNTAVFSAGELEVRDMATAGIWLNLVSVILITLAVYYWLPIALGIGSA